ncbi:hypothetical protein QUC31_007355, partial [Theobroma cacao]
ENISTCIAKIKDFNYTEGWYYIGCKICMKALQQIGESFWCLDPKHGEQTPHLCYKLIMTVQDYTRSIAFVIFGDDSEKVVSASITKLALLNQLDRYILLEPVAKLINQKKLFIVNLAMKSLETRDLSFKIQSCEFVN